MAIVSRMQKEISVYIHLMEYYSAVKVNKLIAHTKECPNIMLIDKPDIKEWILYNFNIVFKSRKGKTQNKFSVAQVFQKVQKAINGSLGLEGRFLCMDTKKL